MQFDLPTICFAAARAIHFFACLLILGVWVFDRVVLKPIKPLPSGWERTARWLMTAALPVVLISGVVWFGFVAIGMSGLPPADALKPHVLSMVWWQTYFGKVWQWRSMFLLWGVIACIVRTAHGTRAWISLVVGVLLVGSLAFSGHGQTGLSPGWHRLADIVHLLIASVWPMGLLPFGLVLLTLRRSKVSEGSTAASQLTQRFSTTSLAAVTLLGTSGIVNACCLLGSFSALFSTPYGRVLMLKLSLFLIAVMLGVINLLVLKPRLRSNLNNLSRPAGWLQVTTAIEFLLAIVILMIVGLLGTLPPAQM